MNVISTSLVGFLALVISGSAFAADYAIPTKAVSAADERGPSPYCGLRCGCPVADYVRHRQLVQYYPSSFDPRTRDEPHFAYGSVRTYPRFHYACARTTIRTLY